MVATETQQRPRWVRGLRVTVAVVTPVALIVLAVRNRAAVDAGADAIAHADPGWLIAAAFAVTLTWVAAACGQLGATTAPLPPGRMFATQVAGSFVNHVLPAGFGGAALTLRMMRRSGLSNVRAAQAIGLNLTAGVVVHVVSLAAVLAIAGAGTHGLGAHGGLLVTAAVFGVVALAGLVWRGASRHDSPAAYRIREVVADSREALGDRRKATMLWAGSVALPSVHILILDAVVRALDQPTSLLAVAGVYLAASALAALVPSPGGFGSLDVALLAAFTSTGTTAAGATAVIVGYRLLTVWIPMVPSAATLLVLLKRGII